MSEPALTYIHEAKEKHLTTLDISYCGLTELPNDVFEITWLDTLILSTVLSEYDLETKHLQQFGTKNLRDINRIKKLPPNLDWPSARLYHYLNLPVELYTPLFVVSRVAGWSAHVIEQLANNRLIRPRANYIGPASRKFVPLADRV